MDSGLESGSTEDYETDVKLLKSAWRQEKATPEVLQFESALIRRIIEQIQLMEETVEEFTESGIDPLTVSPYQMDLDRTQFLLRSYYRIRLQKIEKYMFHIRDNAESRLYDKEKLFVEQRGLQLSHFLFVFIHWKHMIEIYCVLELTWLVVAGAALICRRILKRAFCCSCLLLISLYSVNQVKRRLTWAESYMVAIVLRKTCNSMQ